MNVIGNGVVVHVPSLFEELEELEKKGVNVSAGFRGVESLGFTGCTSVGCTQVCWGVPLFVGAGGA